MTKRDTLFAMTQTVSELPSTIPSHGPDRPTSVHPSELNDTRGLSTELRLDQFRQEVLAEAQRLELLSTDKKRADVFDSVRRLLVSAKSGAEVRRAQTLLISLTPEEEIRAKLSVLYLDESPIVESALETMRFNFEDIETLSGDRTRVLYTKIISQVHAGQVESELKEIAERKYFLQSFFVFFISLIVFLSFVSLLFIMPADSRQVSRSIIVLLAVLFSGFFGAAFSMIISLGDRVRNVRADDIFASIGYHRIILRPLTGAGGAAVLYFFYESEIVSSDLFPDLSAIGFGESSQGQFFNKDFGRLLLWSFIAGFSERLIPELLGSMSMKSVRVVSPKN